MSAKRGNQPKQPRRSERPVKKPASKPNEELVYGKHSVKSVLLRRPKSVKKLLIAGKEQFYEDLIGLAHRHDVDVFQVPWAEFNRVGGFDEQDKHQGILALTEPRPIYTERDFGRLDSANCVVLLDQVSNPQNFATILRSAAFFRADAVVFMKNRSATPTPEVVRFAVGGAEMVDLYCVVNIASTIDELKERGYHVLGMDERGERTLAEVDVSQKTGLVIGAEGEGLRPKTKSHCSELVRIPGGRSGMESLNAAVAATVALYEYGRLMKS